MGSDEGDEDGEYEPCGLSYHEDEYEPSGLSDEEDEYAELSRLDNYCYIC